MLSVSVFQPELSFFRCALWLFGKFSPFFSLLLRFAFAVIRCVPCLEWVLFCARIFGGIFNLNISAINQGKKWNNKSNETHERKIRRLYLADVRREQGRERESERVGRKSRRRRRSRVSKRNTRIYTRSMNGIMQNCK